MRVLGVIPARYKSTRLPFKPLIQIKGKPIIQWVYENASKSRFLDTVIVATDHRKILDCVYNFGGKAVMTSKAHKSGTDRVYEVAQNLNPLIVINIQGDEPFIDYRNIDKVIRFLLGNRHYDVATLIFKINQNAEEISRNPNIVKVVVDKEFNALYFSRSPIPYNRNKEPIYYYKHIGLYGYRMSFLKRFVDMKSSFLENAESLEQLRILENGFKIKALLTKIDSFSIDTKEELRNVESGRI
ncbi:MAG: 3-deoxy-manno-octulosonate cytidylyltransferase [Ignavibacteria bacterium]